MTDNLQDQPPVPMQATHGCLIVSLQVDLEDSVLRRFQSDLLQRIQVVQPKGIIIDLSGVVLFDSHEFASLRRAMDMARLMGCATVLVGIQPGMAASLAELDVDCDQLLTARSLAEAFDRIDALTI